MDKKILIVCLFGLAAGFSPVTGRWLKWAEEALGLGLPYIFSSGLGIYWAGFLGAAFAVYFSLAGAPPAGFLLSAASFLAAFAAGSLSNRLFSPYQGRGTWYTGFLPVEVLMGAGAAIACFAAVLAVFRLESFLLPAYASSGAETSEFSCAGVNGFTFRYPVFKNWGVQSIQNEKVLRPEYKGEKCHIRFSPPAGMKLEVPPQLIVEKIPELGLSYMQGELISRGLERSRKGLPLLSKTIKVTPLGVSYDLVFDQSLYTAGYQQKPGQWDYLQFYGPDFGVRLWPVSIGNGDGFPLDAFVGEVIKSFKLEAGAKETAVVFRKGTDLETAKGILKAFIYPFREGSDSSRGKKYFYSTGPKFLVSAGADGTGKLKRALASRPEIYEVYSADLSVQKD